MPLLLIEEKLGIIIMSSNADLITCYLSEQIPEAEWHILLDETPGLREAWNEHLSPLKNEDTLKAFIAVQFTRIQEEVSRVNRSLERAKRIIYGSRED